MKRILVRAVLVAAAFSIAAIAQAKVPQAEADQLKKNLTPMGAEKAASKDGQIPVWAGGLTTAPACYKGTGTRYCDPFVQDKPQFTITPANVQQYAARLSVGQLAMF